MENIIKTKNLRKKKIQKKWKDAGTEKKGGRQFLKILQTKSEKESISIWVHCWLDRGYNIFYCWEFFKFSVYEELTESLPEATPAASACSRRDEGHNKKKWNRLVVAANVGQSRIFVSLGRQAIDLWALTEASGEAIRDILEKHTEAYYTYFWTH